MGSEEGAIIRPAIERLAGEGMNIEGPFPADGFLVPANGETMTGWLPCIMTRVFSPSR